MFYFIGLHNFCPCSLIQIKIWLHKGKISCSLTRRINPKCPIATEKFDWNLRLSINGINWNQWESISVRNFGCPCERDNQKKSRRTTTKYWCSCPTDNHKSLAKGHLCTCILSKDIQKLGRTTKNCNLVVRRRTVYISLIRTLESIIHLYCYRNLLFFWLTMEGVL